MAAAVAERRSGQLLAVFLGGALGTAARIGLGQLSGEAEAVTAATLGASVPQGLGALTDTALAVTLLVNLAGSLLMGIVAGIGWPRRLAWLRAGVGAGFCGGFTTFSLVALAFAALGADTPWAWGLLVGGLVGGLLLAAVGLQLGAAVRLREDAAGAQDDPGGAGAGGRGTGR